MVAPHSLRLHARRVVPAHLLSRAMPAALLGSLGMPSPAAETPAPTRPHVLILSCDDLNTYLGCYGNPVARTPNIDRLARRGVRFTNAFAQWPSCLPSRASFLSGWAPPRTRIVDFSARSRTGPLANALYLPQHFRNLGYTTVRLDKVFHIGADDPASWTHSEEPLFGVNGDNKPYWTGIELSTLGIGTEPRSFRDGGETFVPVIESGRFDRARGETGSFSRLDNRVPEEAVFDGMTAARAAHYLDQFGRSGEPFLLAVGLRRPHLPWIVHERYFDLYPPELLAAPPVQPGTEPTLTDDERRRMLQAYLASTSFVDAQVGKVLDALERNGLADNTIIILLGDHGYAFGEREGRIGKGNLWDAMLRPAFVIAAPGRAPENAVVDTPVSLLDIYPTLVELGALPAPATPLDGASLVPLLRDPHAEPERVAISFHHERGATRLDVSVRSATHRYIEPARGPVELYDVAADPFHWNNLADDPALADVRRHLASLAQRALANAAPIAAGPAAEETD